MTLGQRIQALRKEHDLSQEGLGEKLGVSRQAISRWEMDGAVPEVDKLIAMSKLFQIPLGQLLGVEEPKPPSRDGRRPRWWRALAALLILLAAVLMVQTVSYVHLLHQYRQVSQQLAFGTEAVPCRSSYLFTRCEYALSGITLGFPQARGSETLTADFTFQLSDALKGWEIVELTARIQGGDPWGRYPDGTRVPDSARSWARTETLPIQRSLFGPTRGTLVLPEYGGETVAVDVVLREKSSGQTIQVRAAAGFYTDPLREENFAVNAILPLEPSSSDTWTEVPPPVAALLPYAALVW